MTRTTSATRPLPVSSPLTMTPGRRIALAIGVPVALVFIGWIALTAVSYAGPRNSFRVSLRIPVHGPQASLAVDNGQVTVGPGGAGLIRAHGIARYGLFRPAVSWHSTAAGAAIRASCRSLPGPCSVNLAVTMPGTLPAEITDNAGDMAVSGLRGPVTLRDESGNVRASALTGSLLIRDQSGDVTVAGPSGHSVIIKDQSGNILATGMTDPDVTVQNNSGDVTLMFASVPVRVQVTCQSGDVRLVLPPGGTAYRVHAATSSGNTNVGVPVNPSSPHVITITNQSGDISISR